MFFIVFARDRDGSADLRAAHRQQHVDYWAGKSGVVKVAGAMMRDDTEQAEPVGSSFLIEAESEATVRDLIAQDPFTKEGVFGDDVAVQRIRPAIGDWMPAA